MTETHQDNAKPCFHCGEAVPKSANYWIRIDGDAQPACCRGCEAVAQTIIDSGNADYYRLRTDLPKTPEAALEELKQLKLYDLPEVQQSFVKSEGEVREASLILEGIVCAACVWLNERHMHCSCPACWRRTSTSRRTARPGALGREPHPSVRHPECISRDRLPPIPSTPAARRNCSARSAIPPSAAWPSPAGHDAGDDVRRAGLPGRCEDTMTKDIEALLRFASLLLTTPVVFYSAWPFFQGAWRDLKLMRAGMDVPVALGWAPPTPPASTAPSSAAPRSISIR
jgi:Cu2+-exporting ATPase